MKEWELIMTGDCGKRKKLTIECTCGKKSTRVWMHEFFFTAAGRVMEPRSLVRRLMHEVGVFWIMGAILAECLY